MNTINAATTFSQAPPPVIPTAPLSPETPATNGTDLLSAIERTDQVDLTIEIDPTTQRARVQPVLNPTAWSPGMWSLLNRYEYLFPGMLPDQGEQLIVLDHDQSQPTSSLGEPHWDESNLINPPPAAATLHQPSMEELPAEPVGVSPQPVGTFVDVVA